MEIITTPIGNIVTTEINSAEGALWVQYLLPEAFPLEYILSQLKEFNLATLKEEVNNVSGDAALERVKAYFSGLRRDAPPHFLTEIDSLEERIAATMKETHLPYSSSLVRYNAMFTDYPGSYFFLSHNRAIFVGAREANQRIFEIFSNPDTSGVEKSQVANMQTCLNYIWANIDLPYCYDLKRIKNLVHHLNNRSIPLPSLGGRDSISDIIIPKIIKLPFIGDLPEHGYIYIGKCMGLPFYEIHLVGKKELIEPVEKKAREYLKRNRLHN